MVDNRGLSIGSSPIIWKANGRQVDVLGWRTSAEVYMTDEESGAYECCREAVANAPSLTESHLDGISERKRNDSYTGCSVFDHVLVRDGSGASLGPF